MVLNSRFRLIVIYLLSIKCTINVVLAQDTVPYYSHLKLSTNEDLRIAIDLYGKYIDGRMEGNIDYQQFWVKREIEKYAIPDLASHYLLPKENTAIMGVAKLDSSHLLLKTVGFMDQKHNETPEIMYVYNYIVHKDNGTYRLGNYLDYFLQKEKLEYTNGSYGTYYGVSPGQTEGIDSLFKKIELFFEKKFDHKFTIVNFNNALESLNARGYDYFIGTLNSKTTISGLFNPHNNIMYVTNSGSIHVHEILRSLHVLLPKSPVILRNGIANLCGGSLGLSIKENINSIYPYLKDNKEVLNDIDNFYYYDDQVVPHAVFTAIVTNYYIKKFGLEAFKELMATESHTEISLSDFMSEFCDVNDLGGFLIKEMGMYLNKDLEYVDVFKD